MKKLAIILGRHGTLGNFVAKQVPNDFQLVGVDCLETEDDGQFIFCDMRSQIEIGQAVNTLCQREFSYFTLISTIGVFGEPTLTGSFNQQSFYEVMQVNLLGVSHFISSFTYHMLEKEIPGRIVVVSSTAADVGSLNLAYGASKGGLNSFVVSLSKSVAPKGITAIGVSPGIFDSPMSRNVSKERQQAAVEACHIKHIPSAEDIAQVVHFAAFSAPDHLTGEIIRINGGQYR
jgi:3-oxoacyl-[acyl-carrier protein] reductase